MYHPSPENTQAIVSFVFIVNVSLLYLFRLLFSTAVDSLASGRDWRGWGGGVGGGVIFSAEWRMRGDPPLSLNINFLSQQRRRAMRVQNKTMECC